MNLKRLSTLITIFVFVFSNNLLAQSVDAILNRGEVHGNFSLDMQHYKVDSLIGANTTPDEDVLMNAFANFIYTNGDFSAGFRYESYLNALQGFPTKYKGNGIGYRFASYTNDDMTVTVGNYYEQFGNGLIFRTYEARGLGYDNVMDGIRINYKLREGLYVKGIIGKQRLYFEQGEGILRGIDGELMVNDFIGGKLKESKTKLTLGGSFISKYQADQSSQYNLPENVGAYSGRFLLRRGKISFNGEYAYKINDPSADNNFIYKDGQAFYAETTYSTKGFGLSLSAKGNDNMSYRSDRNAGLQDLQINYIPALTRQHTYNLLATLYPYATQPNGEMAFQGELVYKLKKKSFLGGKYGTGILINYSTIYNIDSTAVPSAENDSTRMGYTTNLFSIGDERYYDEINVEITKKFSKKFKGIFTYSNMMFNQAVIQGKNPKKYPNVYANIGVIDLTYKINKKHAIRAEIQGLITEQDQQDWATVVLEYSYSPHWFIAIMDQYNYGNEIEEDKIHYYFASAGYVKGANRIQLGYGRQRAGIFCIGGVCRTVPAANGLTLSITSSF
ncbi:MAG: hypothetical protein COB15_03595 [Flavobacteriales bacterium]|nr:MAG: hypothetical protein COB15_03595 [Flavobacteriales bacterium]